MFHVAFEMALLPIRLTWRCLRRGLQAWPRSQRRWRTMALPAPAPAVMSARGPVPGVAAVPGQAGPLQVQESPPAPAPQSEPEPAPELELARFHSREGDGFKLIFHFMLKQQRVRRTVWLDFTRLARRMGKEQAWAMRARLGHAQMRYAVDQPTRPWGRLELPQAWLAVDSTRSQKARGFMLETLDAVNALIDEGGIALVSGRHQSLPAGDPAPASPPGRSAGERSLKSAGKPAASRTPPAQSELPLGADATVAHAPATQPVPPPMPAIEPDPSEDAAGLPRGVVPEHVCTGYLAAVGFTERTDATGRNYRIFYADVDVDGRLSRQTGADLERALTDARAAIGMRVRLQHLGYVPVNGGRHRRKVWQAAILPG